MMRITPAIVGALMGAMQGANNAAHNEKDVFLGFENGNHKWSGRAGVPAMKRAARKRRNKARH